MSRVYITRTSNFLPNQPVSNDEMESFLGLINGQASRSRRMVLRNNGIVRRFYALTKDGKATHTNAQMTALAVRNLFQNKSEELKKMQLLCCGTSSPDQLMPSHAVMTHGFLPESGNVEVVSSAGVCCAGMHALKYAYMAVKTGEVQNAVATGSDRSSRMMRSDVFVEEVQKLEELEKNPYISFDKDFLRWMLSDGAAAFLLSDKKNESGISLELEWIEGASFANTTEACMYMAAEKMSDGSLKSFMDYSQQEIIDQSILSVKQDIKLLGENIVRLGAAKLKEVMQKKCLRAEEVDYLLPHMSSEFFRNKIDEELKFHGIGVPQNKWFTNLAQVGNVGSASAYLMVDELFNSGKLKKGEKILLLVPESSRFSYMFALLSVC